MFASANNTDFLTGTQIRVVPLLGIVRLFLLTRDRQIPSRAPDMAIRREQSSSDGALQSNNTLKGDYRILCRSLTEVAVPVNRDAASSRTQHVHAGFANDVNAFHPLRVIRPFVTFVFRDILVS